MMCLPETTTTAGSAQGGVVLVFRYRTQGWSVKSTRFHKMNVVSCEVVSGRKWTLLVDAPPPTITWSTYLTWRMPCHASGTRIP